MNQEKYSYEIREGWSTDSDGDSHHVKDIIAFNDEQIDKWLKENYNLENSDNSMSDDTMIIYEYSQLYNCNSSDLSEKTEDCKLCDNGEIDQCENHYWRSDSITANKSENPLTKDQLEYFKSGNHYCSVIDLTEEDQ